MPRGGRPASAEIARRDPDPIVRPAVAALAAALLPTRAAAKHIADGVLPITHCALWAVAFGPFLGVALRVYRRRAGADPFTAALRGGDAVPLTSEEALAWNAPRS